MLITQRPSPNHRPRNGEERVRLVILHATYMASDDEALQRLTDPATQVSCHYYITRKGEVVQLVAEENTAWHAGQSRWMFEDGVEVQGLNGHSIGIELGNSGPYGKDYPSGPPASLEKEPNWAEAEPFPEAQIEALISLLKDICHRHGLNESAIVGHDQVAPGRKTDPGPHFPMARVRAALRA